MIDLSKLRYFVVLARRLNYARAAEELGISQPAMTRAIQSLESQLGFRLFDRGRSGVSLTPQGKDFAERASVLVADAEDLERHASLATIGKRGRVRFGMAPMPAAALLARSLKDRIDEAPDLINDVVVKNVEGLWPLLTSGEIEFFVSAEGQVPDAPPVRMSPLGTFPLSYLVRKCHPLLTGSGTSKRYPVLISNRPDITLPVGLRNRTIHPPHVIEDFGALAALTASTDAIWISSTFALSTETLATALVELPVDHAPGRSEYRIMMYSLDRRSQSPAALLLKDRMTKLIRILGERP